jgi:hypothetical protein
MNTQKQVIIMSALLMVTLIIIGIYAAWYPSRATDAEEHFEEATAERGSILFARNCRLCHGDLAEGGALGARLPAAPALNRPDLQGFVDAKAELSAAMNATSTELRFASEGATTLEAGDVILIETERMRIKSINGSTAQVERGIEHTEAASHPAESPIYAFDQAALAERERLITNTITCGRVGTAMPAWAQEHGGPLSEEQIRQLKVLITTARWDLVEHEIDIEDAISARLSEPLTADETFMGVTDVSVFNEDEAIRIGEERLRVTSVPPLPQDARGQLPRDRSGFIVVERGVLGTTPFDHSEEERIYRFPEVSEPSILQQSCGQTARPAAPSGPPELIEPFEGQTVEITAQGVQFNTDEIRANRSTPRIRVRLNNLDTGVDHNIAFYQSATNLQPIAPTAIGTTFPGPGVDDTAFDIPNAGTYFFRCDVHPTTMTGDFIVTQ